jgi:hypothetical protein
MQPGVLKAALTIGRRDLFRQRRQARRESADVGPCPASDCPPVYLAMVVVSERGDVMRFRYAKQAGAYSKLTPLVKQSGRHCYTGYISCTTTVIAEGQSDIQAEPIANCLRPITTAAVRTKASVAKNEVSREGDRWEGAEGTTVAKPPTKKPAAEPPVGNSTAGGGGHG